MLPLSNSDSLTPCFLLQQLGAVFPLVFLSHHTKSRDRPGNKIAATSFIHKSAWILGTAKWAIVVISHSLPPCSQNVLFLLLLWEQEQGKNNLELPFPSPLQIKYNGKKKTGGCQILKGWCFFFWAIYRSSVWCCRFLSLNFINGLCWVHFKGQQVLEQWTQAAFTSGLQKPSQCLQETG